MYKVLGSDQKEYGPVTADFIRQWIAERRLNAQSLIQAEGAVGWQSLSFHPEFTADLARQAPLPTPAFQPVSYIPPQTNNGMALASLILGCLSIICCQPLSVLGIIFGIIALSQIKQDPHQSGPCGFRCRRGPLRAVAGVWIFRRNDQRLSKMNALLIAIHSLYRQITPQMKRKGLHV